MQFVISEQWQQHSSHYVFCGGVTLEKASQDEQSALSRSQSADMKGKYTGYAGPHKGTFDIIQSVAYQMAHGTDGNPLNRSNEMVIQKRV